VVVQQKLMQEGSLNVSISPSASQATGGANISLDASRRLPVPASDQVPEECSGSVSRVVASGGPRDF
jgi:hypothetical protein